MAGIKISDLPTASTLTGTETIAVVQSSSTKSTTVGDIAAAVSGDFVTNTQYAATSGASVVVSTSSATWDGVYTDYQSTSANFARLDTDNTFCGTQTMAELKVQHLEAGFLVTANGACASVLGGYYNDANGSGSAVVAGNNNDTFGNFSTITGGSNNCIEGLGANGFIGGGEGNVVKHCNAVALGTCTMSVSASMVHMNKLQVTGLPTSDPGVTGVVWNDSGTLKIS